MPTHAHELLDELRRRGIELRPHGDRLRYRPREALTPELAERVRAHKTELLEILEAECGDPPAPTRPSRPTDAVRLVGRTVSVGLSRTPFRFTDGVMNSGDICAGWTPAGWAIELRRKATCCDEYRPDIAEYYQKWAEDIERRLPARTTRRLTNGD